MRKLILILLSLSVLTSLYGCSAKKDSTTDNTTISKNTLEKKEDETKEKIPEKQYIAHIDNSPNNITDENTIKEIDTIIEKTLNSIDEEVQMCLDKTLLSTIKEQQSVIEVAYKSEQTVKFQQKSTKEETSYTYEKLYILLDTKKFSPILDNAIILQKGHKYDMLTSTFNPNIKPSAN